MPTAQRVIVVFYDGMRPDHIRPDLTPRLHALAMRDGAWYRRAAAVYVTVTRPNTASISTGAYPGKHGIYVNAHTNPGGHRDEFAPLRPLYRGRIIPIPTLAEALVGAGKRMTILGSGTAGMTTLMDPQEAVTTIHATFTHPDTLMAQMVERFGPVPPKTPPVVATNDWLADVLLDHVLPETAPDVVFMMSCEPDTSQHRFGLGSPQALDAIRGNDRRLGRILDAVEASDVPTTVIVVSDHGHSTITGFVDLQRELTAGGFADALAANRFQYGQFDNAITVTDGPDNPGLAERLGAWLVAQPWTSGVFAHDDTLAAAVPGVLPVRRLWNDQAPVALADAPTFSYSHTWTDAANAAGVAGGSLSRVHEEAGFERQPGRALSPESQLVSMHGSLSPTDVCNTLVLAGAGVRPGMLDVPGGTIDIAPTVLALLGLSPAVLPDADGRFLSEAFANGPDPSTIEVRTEHLADLRSGALCRHWVYDRAYLETSTAARQ